MAMSHFSAPRLHSGVTGTGEKNILMKGQISSYNMFKDKLLLCCVAFLWKCFTYALRIRTYIPRFPLLVLSCAYILKFPSGSCSCIYPDNFLNLAIVLVFSLTVFFASWQAK